MSWVAVAVAGAAVVGGVLQSRSSEDAARTQNGVSKEATALQREMYNQQRKDYEPWRQAGVNALSGLQNPAFQKDFSMADYQADPGYNFRLQEGQKAINAAASARGNAGGGATMKALTRYGQDYASGEYQKAYDRYNENLNTRYNRLSNLAGLGQTATQGNANASQNYGANAASNMMAGANAISAGQIAQGNAYAGTISNIGNVALQSQYLNRRYPQG